MSNGQSGRDWLEPGTFSVWVWDRSEGDKLPIFCLFEEWEVAGLRGLIMVAAFSSLDLLYRSSEQELDADYGMAAQTIVQPESLGPREIAELVAKRDLIRVGRMPALKDCVPNYAHVRDDSTSASPCPTDQ